MHILCFVLLIGKLIYDAAKRIYAECCAEHKNPYTFYRRHMDEFRKKADDGEVFSDSN